MLNEAYEARIKEYRGHRRLVELLCFGSTVAVNILFYKLPGQCEKWNH